MLVENFAKYPQITATAMFAIDLYSKSAIEIFIQKLGCGAIGCKAGLNVRSATARFFARSA
jgi:hypothetical protein